MQTVLAMARKAADHTDEAQVTTESKLKEVRFSNPGGKWDSQKCLSTSIANALTHLSLMK